MTGTARLYTMCPDAAAAQQTVDALLFAGVRKEDITVISAEPFDRCEFGQREKSTLMPWLVVIVAD